jgi:hypothetical protein
MGQVEYFLWKEVHTVPRITIREEVYKKIEAQAQKEGVSPSKLAEKLLMETATPKTMYCPRCAFRF